MRLPRRLSLAVFVGLLSLELLLQVGAAVAWLGAGSTPTASGGNTVLCIGDSYTYGLGASATSKAYPAVLQDLLRQQLPQAKVANAGWPGQNSREALLRLDEQLTTHKPRVVCLLVGLNDSWTRPAAVTAADLAAGSPSTWQWRWRTWRLLQWLFGGSEAPGAVIPPTAAAPAKAGAVPKEGASREFLEQVVAEVKAGRPSTAVQMLEQAMTSDPRNAAEYHQGLVLVHTAVGQRDKAQASLSWLATEYAQRPTRQVAESYAMSLYASGDRQAAAAIARVAAPRFPAVSALWWLSGQGHYEAGDVASAESDLDQAVATAGNGDTGWQATVHRDAARACCGRDVGKAIRHLLAALQLDRDVERCRLVVEGAAAAFTKESTQRCLSELHPTAADAELLQRLFGTSFGERGAMCEVLAGHLRQIVTQCKERGVSVLLLTYPLPVADVEAVQAEVARSLQVPLVRCLPTFEAQLQQKKRSDLYIPDGHCTDAGYGLMAQLVADPVRQILQR